MANTNLHAAAPAVGPDTPHNHHTHAHDGHDAAEGGHGGHGGHDKHAGHDPEMFRRRFWLSLALTIPLVVTSEMVMDWFGYELDFAGMELLGPVLGSIVFWWGGWPFLAGGAAEVRDRQPGMMLLITMAIVVAYVASMATSLDWFELDFWWELAALVTIMLLGHWQEMKAIGQAQGALAALAELLPDDAERVAPDGTVEPVAIADLAPGDVVLVRSGGRVPADGVVVDGEAELDESMITGESRPVARGEGDRVVAGTVSTDSAIRVRVDAVGEDTTLAGIQRLVAEAQASGSRAQVLADRFAALLFYVAAGAALVTFLVWWGLGDLDDGVVRTVTVLVIACPHALGLAIPLVISLSTAVAAKAGILVKDRLALERMRTVDAVLFDKTGTLTRGAHVVAGVAAAAGTTEDDVLRIAGGVESDSEHPLARAIVTAARERGELAPAADFRSITGRGVEATVDGEAYAVGGPALLRERDLTVPPELDDDVSAWTGRGAAVLHLVRGDDHRGRLRPRGRDPARGAPGGRRAPGRRRAGGHDHRRRPPGGRRRRRRAGHRRGVRRGPARGQGQGRRRAAAAGIAGGDGGRRRQRRPRPGPRRRRAGDRCRHRRRHRVRRCGAGLQRPPGRLRRHPAVPGHLPQDGPEPGLGGRVQRPRHPARRRCPGRGRVHPVTGRRRGADERLHHRGGPQRPAAAAGRPHPRSGRGLMAACRRPPMSLATVTHQGEPHMTTTATFTVTGMTCDHCVAAVREEIARVEGVAEVDVDLGTGAVTVQSDRPVDATAVAAAVDEAGYALSTA